MFEILNLSDVTLFNINTNEVIDEIKCLQSVDTTNHFIKAVKVEKGLKVDVRDYILKQWQEEPYIKENFKLNIKRLNRWWYSVYFDDICNHDGEPLVFNDGINEFCSKCRVIL